MAVVGKKSGTTARWDKLDSDVCIEWTTLSQTDLVTSHAKSLRWITPGPSHDAHTRTGQAGSTRKSSYCWQTRATRKYAKNCSNSTCLQRCRWQYWPIVIRLAVVVSEICEIPRNSLKIQTYVVHGHPRSSVLVSMESPYMTSY